MLTIESTIIDIAIGTDDTDLLKASVWLGSDLVVSLRIGISGSVDGETKLSVLLIDGIELAFADANPIISDLRKNQSATP